MNVATDNKEQCQYCRIKPVLSVDGSFFEWNNERTIAEGECTTLNIGVDRQGNVVIRACGDDYTHDYYPKYCPECGRKLILQGGNKNA